MNLDNYREPLQLPVSDAQPCGEQLSNNEQLDYIESQMMKVGSLAHSEVQWTETENKVIDLLRSHSKDVRLLSYLMQCLQNQASLERLIMSLYVLSDFISLYWESSYPSPGEKGKSLKRRYYTQIIQRSLLCVQKMTEIQCTDELNDYLGDAILLLRSAAEKQALPLDDIDEVHRLIRRKLVVNTAQEELTTASIEVNSKSTVAPELDIETSSNRSIKQSLLKITDFLSEQEHGLALSLRLRRYASWFSITGLPEIINNNETSLAPVSADRVADYEQQLAQSANKDLWQRVEKSLMLAPFWLDGHYLSAQIAQNLGLDECSRAIKDELNLFLQRLPQLTELHFKGGTPFISSQTQQWLHERPVEVTDGTDWRARRDQVLQMAQQQGLSTTLTMLNESITNACEPRDQFYWQLLSTEVMHQQGLFAMSKQNGQTLLDQVSQLPLTQWEPSFIQRLKKIAETN